MKKIVLFLFALALSAALLVGATVLASAEDEIVRDRLGELTWELNLTTGELVISGEGEMGSLADVSAWLIYSKSIRTVVIREGVTSIGNHAFKHCKNLSSVSIPSSVTSIGYLSFRYCEQLTEITIPDSCTYVDDDAFSGCEQITTMTIPSAALAALPQHGVKRVTLTNGDHIPDSAFAGRSGLISISLPDTITSIGHCAFSGCSELKSIELPDGVTSIGDRAFENCRSLESIRFPDSLEWIGEMAFFCCKSLTAIPIPKSMTCIEYRTFEGCKSLTSIVIPEGVESIDYRAFYDCDSLTEIILPDQVTSIGNFAFADCRNLKKIVIPNGIQTISGYAFSTTDSIETVVLPIAALSLVPKTSLKTVIFTSGSKIPEQAFKGCSTLQTVIFCGSDSEWTSLQSNKNWMNGLGQVQFQFHEAQWELTDTTHTGVCTLCHAEISGRHTWDGGVVTTKPTHLTTGIKTYRCTVCDKTKENELQRTAAHTYGNWSAFDERQHKKTCACGDIVYGDHAYGSWTVITPPTEESEGVRRGRCTCGHQIDEVIPTLTHEYVAEVVAPTCTEQGYTAHTCKNCGDVYKDTYTDALGHVYDGDRDERCNVCNEPREAVTEERSETATAPADTAEKESGCNASFTDGLGAACLLIGTMITLFHKKRRVKQQ